MDQCEDREEGVPPSKSTLCGEHESQTKAQRNPPGPPPSSVSYESNRFKDVIKRIEQRRSAEKKIRHRVKPGPPPSSVSYESNPFKDVIKRIEQRRSAEKKGTKRKHEPGPSCVSLKSDWSEDRPINFKVYAAERGTKLKHEPGPSCVSLKSDWSADRPINLKVRPLSAAERLTEVHKKMMMEEYEDRAEFAGSSFPSMRSDLSQGRPPAFSAEPGLTRGQRSQSAGSSCPSVRSDMSRDEPPYYNAEPRATSFTTQVGDPTGKEVTTPEVKWVWLKVYKRKWDEPRWTGPFEVTTRTSHAVQLKGKGDTWYHWSQCAAAEEPRRSERLLVKKGDTAVTPKNADLTKEGAE